MLHRENKESDFTLEKKEPQSPGARSNQQNRHRDRRTSGDYKRSPPTVLARAPSDTDKKQ